MAEAEVVGEDGAPTPTTEIELVQHSALMQPVGPAAEILAANRAYQTLCESLLVADDYQQIGEKRFRKKSAWRKLAAAFGVSDRIVEREYERNDAGQIIRAEFVVEAVAPNGRSAQGYGACDLYEKCCAKATCKKNWQSHKHCDQDEGHDPRTHFAHDQHDIPSTAQTRAKNRALSDLFGMGEVSAEEVGEPERWEVLGWPTSTGFRNLMDPLSAALKADSALAEKWKEWRSANGVEWPVPYSAARQVRAWMGHNINADSGDDEYAEAPVEGAGPAGQPGTEAPRAEAAPPPSTGDTRERSALVGQKKPAAKESATSKPPTKAQLQRLAIACNELAGDGDKDRYRHALIDAVTEGRVQSATKATAEEVRVAIDATVKIGEGRARLVVHGDEGRLAKLVPVERS